MMSINITTNNIKMKGRAIQQTFVLTFILNWLQNLNYY